MCLFAEKVGWTMQRSEERLVEEFCKEVGVRREVLQVWMHNNKRTLGKRDRATRSRNHKPR
ncbi:Octamer-binding transcription factor [Parasponia andersonii]|uniref:Octamer-binding transcription factor n=1 Tax=Parasponia andersonii TaxID=3476 RepID=A0A2P5C7Q4_PARAD|nr:Octamer-binding transcription factor [Parasponia andersonii]